MGKLTTHVLDTAHGCPGKGIALRLYRVSKGKETLLVSAKTNADGRCDAPILSGSDMKTGAYRLEFEAGKYFKAMGVKLPKVTQPRITTCRCSSRPSATAPIAGADSAVVSSGCVALSAIIPKKASRRESKARKSRFFRVLRDILHSFPCSQNATNRNSSQG